MGRVMGIDPGLANTGISIIEEHSGSFSCLYSETITTSPRENMANRLKKIYTGSIGIIERFGPDSVSMETLYVAELAKPVMLVAEARGVLFLSAGISNIPVHEYAPREVKKSIVGYGNAPKKQVRDLLSFILGKGYVHKSFHEADAAALAITHINNKGLQEFL